MKKISIDKTDECRVLLTEVLPYETPIFFSNEGFYRFCREHLATAPLIFKKVLCGWENDQPPRAGKLKTVPYNYHIRKGTLDTRTLSLMHPAVQLRFTDLYKQFAHIIIHLCNRSPFSLRYPVAIGSAFYWPDDRTTDGSSLQYSSAYFDYEKYGFLYRFFDSYEFHRLEKRFHHLRTFDISKCFNHIYTHTLSWAVRSKSFAKRHLRRRTFDAMFDEIMQASNHGETAGILIGPEVSRLFAEVILQRVDSVVVERLRDEKPSLKQGVDYDIRRYVDDYFVFSSSREIGHRIMQVYHHELSLYRLYFNEAKSAEFVVPFMTPISCAKLDLSSALNDFFASAVERVASGDKESVELKLRTFWNPAAKASSLIQKIKAAVMAHKIEYASITGFLFAVIETQLQPILASLPTGGHKDKAVSGLLYALLDVSFFIYAMDVRVSTTYKIARLSLSILKALRGRQEEIVEQIKKKISDEAIRVLAPEVKGHPELYVETLDLLAVLRILGTGYAVPTETLDEMITAFEKTATRDRDDLRVEYFLATALLFHMGGEARYAVQKARLETILHGFFNRIRCPFERADFTCLFLDLLSCPFLDDAFKRRIVDVVKINNRLLSVEEKRDIVGIAPQHLWFTDWSARDSVEVLLEKKRYRTPY